MARKKKIETDINAENKEQKVEEQKSSSTSTIGYKGTVKVSLVNGKKIISTKIFHNSGRISLFKFICNCLAGNYTSSDKPQRIAIFTGSDTESIYGEDTILYSKEKLSSNAILTDTTPIVSLVNSNTSKYYTVTYHFRLPYSYVFNNSIYKAALFNSSPDLSTTNKIVDSLYADFKFTITDEAGEKWDPVEIENKTQAGNYSLVIEWTMSLKNS